MKNKPKILFFLCVIMALNYSCISFVNMSFNPIEWGFLSRLLMGYVGFLILAYIALVCFNILDEE